jgi:hypothetical protein
LFDPTCSPAELRRLEDRLDWLENQRPRPKAGLFVSPLPAAGALALDWLWRMTEGPAK